MSLRALTVEQLDEAVRAHAAKLGRFNERLTFCDGCRQRCGPRQARALWIEGRLRGWLCRARCAQAVP